MVEFEGQIHPADYLEPEGLPPILLITSRQFVEDKFRGVEGYFTRKEDKLEIAQESISNAYINTLATIRLNGRGISNPSYEAIISEAEIIKTQLKNGEELQGITYKDPEGKVHQLTGKPLIFMLTPYYQKRPPWPAVDGYYTYYFLFNEDVNIMEMNLTIPHLQRVEEFSYGITKDEEMIRQSYTKDLFEMSLILGFRLMAGKDFMNPDWFPLSRWYNSGFARAMGDSINPYYTDDLRELDKFRAEMLGLTGAERTEDIPAEVWRRYSKDKSNPYSNISRLLKSLDSSFFVLERIDLLEPER